jgi:hypothetical protein
MLKVCSQLLYFLTLSHPTLPIFEKYDRTKTALIRAESIRKTRRWKTATWTVSVARLEQQPGTPRLIIKCPCNEINPRPSHGEHTKYVQSTGEEILNRLDGTPINRWQHKMHPKHTALRTELVTLVSRHISMFRLPLVALRCNWTNTGINFSVKPSIRKDAPFNMVTLRVLWKITTGNYPKKKKKMK